MSENWPTIVATLPSRAPRVDPPSRGPAPFVAGSPRQDSGPQSLSSILAVIERLEQVVDQETEALRQGRPGDLRDFNARKSHGLLELSRAARALDGEAGSAVGPRLRSLRAKLERNSAVLKTHLAAVQEVSSIMAGALREADSDGTYAQLRQLSS